MKNDREIQMGKECKYDKGKNNRDTNRKKRNVHVQKQLGEYGCMKKFATKKGRVWRALSDVRQAE